MALTSYRVLHRGCAEGELIVLTEPLSMWGGLDPESGNIIDTNHPQAGLNLKARLVAMPFGRGSSSASSVLAESIRLGTAPAGFVLDQPDPILAIGAMVGSRLYQKECPIIVGPAPKDASGVWRIEDDRFSRVIEES